MEGNKKNIFLTVCLFVAFLFFGGFGKVEAQVDPLLRERLSRSEIVVDHNSLNLFDQIPESYLERARNMKVYFSDRSVGQNINESLDCLTAASFGSSPANCRKTMMDSINWCPKTYTQTDMNNGVVPPEIRFTPDPMKYNRTNIVYEFKMGTWEELTLDFVDIMYPTRIGANDIVTYQFSYLNVGAENASINDPICGFWATGNRSTCYARFRDIHVGRLTALESQNMSSDKAFIYWTTSLARGIGTDVSTIFNNSMRSFAVNNNKILFDIADIESYDPSGRLCFDNRDGVPYVRKLDGTCAVTSTSENYPDDGQNYPAICQDYTIEVDNGHFSVGGARIRTAKAFWILLAQIAGWNPGGTTSTNGPTVTPTNPPVIIPSNTPTPTLVPADANGDRRVDGIDYVIWISNYNRNTTNRQADGDFNADGRVDGLDYVMWLTNYGFSGLTSNLIFEYSQT
jgi:hypothetical protein